MDLWAIYGAAITISESLLLILLAQTLFEKRHQRYYLLYVICALALFCVIQLIAKYTLFPRTVLMIIFPVVDVSVVFFLFRAKILKVFALCCVFYVFGAILDSLTLLTLPLLNPSYQLLLLEDDLGYHLIATVISRIILLVAIAAVGRFRARSYSLIPIRQWLLFLAIPLVSLVGLVIAFYAQPAIVDSQPELFALISAIVLWLNIVNIVYLFSLDGILIARSTLAAEQQHHQDQEKYLDSLIQSEQRLAKQNHDFRHILSYLVTLLAEPEGAPAARRYTKEALASLGTARPIKTGNKEVDTILNSQNGLMEEQGIKLLVHGRLPGQLPVATLDLVQLLGNALENAWQACAQISDPAVKKEVLFAVNEDPLGLYILLENPFGIQKNRGPQHGYGKQIMRDIVERYGGHLKERMADGKYSLQIFLQPQLADMGKGVNDDDGRSISPRGGSGDRLRADPQLND